jgi:DNA modification methylase
MSILLIHGDARRLPIRDQSVQTVVTSPPYWNLRNYKIPGQLGLEKTPEEYVAVMVDVFREVRRVLRDDGTLWLNMGDSYLSGISSVRTKETPETGIERKLPRNWFADANKIQRNGKPPGWKAKDLVATSWMLALALRADGWYLRCDIIWSKANPMPETVADRPTKAHEYIFLLSKCPRYYFNADAIKEPVTGEAHSRGNGVNPKSVPTGWDTSTGNGGHGNIHRDGRRKKQDQVDKARYTGFNDRWKIKQNQSWSSAMAGILPSGEKRNKRSVWEINPQPFPEAHFATFPEELVKPCVLAGCPSGGIVLDPFVGSGTTALVARDLGCSAIGIELNPEYLEIARRRLAQHVLEFA